MNNILLLVKNYTRLFLSRLAKLVKKESATTKSIALFAILFGGIFIFLFSTISYSTILVARDAGIPEIAISSFSTTLLMFTMMLIVTESSPTKKASDEEILLSLPFKKSEIVASKLIYFCLFDFVILVGLLFPSYIIYYVMVDGTSILLLLRAFLVILFATFLASGLSGIIATFFTKISTKFRYSKIIQSLFSMFLVVGFIIVYLGFTFISQNPNYANQIYSFYPIQLIFEAILNNNSSILIIMIVSLFFFVLSIFIKTHYYGKQISTYNSKDKNLTYKESIIRRTLFKREFGKYFSTPIYVINTAFGPLMILLISLIIAFIGKDYFIKIIEVVIATGYENLEAPNTIMNGINDYFNFGLIVLMSMTLSAAPTTASSISMENKELWILKAHPISYKDVFLSKILVNLVINTVPLLLGCFLLSFSFDVRYIFFILIIPLIVIVMTSIIGLYVNLLYPKFGWESEQEVIKQGMSVLVTMLINMICVILPAILYFIVPVSNQFISLGIMTIGYIVLTIIWIMILNINGKKLYQKL